MNVVPVLLYHSVTDRPSPRLASFATHPAVFRDHIAAVVDSGRRPVTISELADVLRSGRRPEQPMVAVTFDDGFADNADVAAPILEEFGVTATLYVTTRTIGQTADWLGANDRVPMAGERQLRDLSRAGWEIGSHGLVHHRLDELPAKQVRHEAMVSKSVLEDLLGLEVPSFAYPHGAHDETVRKEIIAAGYDSACSVRNALCPLSCDVHRIARVTVGSGFDAARFASLVACRGIKVADHDEALRTTLWRVVRRARRRTRRSVSPGMVR